jgi:hypothetical protein
MAPFALVDVLGKTGAYAIYLLIGMGFGAALEVAGFANSRKLANQFYFKDMTVLKVMFTAIVTAMVLVFLASGTGLLAFNEVYVPPTYLWAGITGGLIMGVGFILGGFCPGTSIVALASLKVDGFFFFLGTLAGVFLFGETVALFQDFWYAGSMGRYLLPEFLGISTGMTVLFIVLMALGAFWMAEKAEATFGKGISDARFLSVPMKVAGAGGLAVVALLVMGMGQPTPMEKWANLPEEDKSALEEREVQIHPGELISVAANRQMKLVLLDVRNERDFNLFHLLDSRRVELEEVARGGLTKELLALPPNAVVILVSNDEVRASEAWKMLTGEGIVNVYLLEGGINGWLDRFAEDGACPAGCRPVQQPVPEGELAWRFDAALGAQHPIANLDLFTDKGIFFVPKIELEVKARPTGGCG